jgi:Xaa-Pro dipeptidase
VGLTPPAEIAARLDRLARGLAAADLAGAILLQQADLFYFTGTVQDGALVVGAEGEARYLVRRSLERAQRESALRRIRPYRTWRDLAAECAAMGLAGGPRLGLELDVLPAQWYLRLQEALPGARWADISPLVRALRAVKSPHEIGLMREAARIADAMARAVPRVARAGMTALEIAAEVEAEGRRRGHQGVLRFRRANHICHYGQLVAGPDALEPSYLDTPLGGSGPSPAIGFGAGPQRVEAGAPIVLDYSGGYAGYAADQTRTFLLGDPPRAVLAAHDAARDILEEARQALRPGVAAGAVYARAMEVARAGGFAETFMNQGAIQVAWVGHGVGLECDEVPVLAQGAATPLEAGMTIAVEPKIVLPGIGAVGIEDTFLVTPAGGEALTFSDRSLGLIPAGGAA